MFDITLHTKDKVLLEQIEIYFSVGNVYDITENQIQYRVSSTQELKVIREHFDKYPLHSKKRLDFEWWKKAFYLIQNKEHLTYQGLQIILAIKASINRGLNDVLKAAFPSITPVQKPYVGILNISDPEWIAGFVNGEGNLFIEITLNQSNVGFQTRLVF